MPQWEYKLFGSQDAPADRGILGTKNVRAELEAYLNALGRDGWEIVDVDFYPTDEQHFAGLAKRERR
jgi:hypothetical protein